MAISMRLVIITGMSGAGKATAARIFEDLSYTVVDNLPPALLPDLIAQHKKALHPAALAVLIDSRTGSLLEGFAKALEKMEKAGVRPTVLFLDASDDVLVQRFKETRRPHPLFEQTGGILEAIRQERLLLESVRERADKVVDTTNLKPHGLQRELETAFLTVSQKGQRIMVTVISFGFKFGLPLDADLIFDVRFLINPHYVDNLRPYDGRHQAIAEYVMEDPDSGVYLDKLYDLVEFSLPRYVEEGKAYLTIAIGCTGGRHRSVVVAEKLGQFLQTRGYRTLIQHRDVEK
ncbi:MAG TPA: RNase adapter RapZ [Capsulimonadaceae bacterium]|nr:RNase adapter RapZ [Capsulimonadaceae bacterium]